MVTANPVLPRPYKIENLLREEQMRISGASIAASSVSGWESNSSPISAVSLSRSTEEMKWTPASLKVFVANNDNTPAIWTDADIPVTPGKTYRAFCWIKTRALSVPVRIGIAWKDQTQNYVFDWPSLGEWSNATSYAVGNIVFYLGLSYVCTQNTTTQSPLNANYWNQLSPNYSQFVVNGNADWTLVSFTGVAPGLDPDHENGVIASHARVRVEIPITAQVNPLATAYDYQTIWVDDVVFTEYAVPDNGFIRLLRRNLPEYMTLLDAEQENPSYPMLRFLDLIGATANRMLNASIGFDYVPPEDGIDGFDRCTLIEPRFYSTDDIAEERWLPWLAYVTATTPYVSTILGGVATPWFALEAEGSDPITWAELEAIPDAPPTWNQIQNLNPSPLPSVSLVTEAIRSKGTGILAGTKEGLRRAARLVLTDDNSFDEPCAVTVAGNVVTAVIDKVVSNTAAMAASGVNLYDTGISALDNDYSTYPVTYSIGGGQTTLTWTATETIDDITSPIFAYVTDRRVEIETGATIWDVIIKTSVAQTPSDVLVLDVAEKAKAAGVKLDHQPL